MSSHNSAPLISVKYILRWGAEHIGISWYMEEMIRNIHPGGVPCANISKSENREIYTQEYSVVAC